ncbi:hypothetical protein TSUD_408770 [Trifolium subterraneum]|uniref:Uncharacterized protein n=1 Tax=Trifolium subterraneum TaxID=3900 RepID=A0A2Z6P198_TRISU|nr:hypothetical protein TSUD_408770 [Trifolium subterraneum]
MPYTLLYPSKKSVRAMAPHPKAQAFASASADNIKKFTLPKGEFCHNMLSQQKTIINAMAVNEEGVMVTGGDNGSMWFWDWKSGHNFQQSQTIVQPGSLDSEAGMAKIFISADKTRHGHGADGLMDIHGSGIKWFQPPPDRSCGGSNRGPPNQVQRQ